MIDEEPEEGSRGSLVIVATLVYSGFVVTALLWLYFRDRVQILPEMAFGEIDAYASLGVGTAVGLGLSGIIALFVRYQAAFQGLEARLRATLGSLSESEIVLIAMTSAIGEELLFRCALQDVVGPYLSALVFGALHTGPGLLLWGACAAILGLCFSLLIDSGCGLLSVTVAHALINFISLRRMTLP
jgi:membrane protease YdiL (CAAX protease family)